MENYPITISKDKAVHHFEVGEYVHRDEDKCKYRVFENGAYVDKPHPIDPAWPISKSPPLAVKFRLL